MLIANDVETHAVTTDGGYIGAPKLVCGSFSDGSGESAVLDAAGTLAAFRELLATPGATLGGANYTFDLGVMAAEDQTLIPVIFQALAEGRIKDAFIREALNAIYHGHLFQDPRNGRSFGTAEEGGRYNVAFLADYHLGRDLTAAKRGVDSWRLRYHELDGTPIGQWPDAAVTYSADDATIEREILESQRIKGYQNLHNEDDQMRAAWVLHLFSLWGFRTDPARVAELEQSVNAETLQAKRRFLRAGLLKIKTCSPDEVAENVTAEDLAAVSSRNDKWIGTAQRAFAKGKRQRFSKDTKALQQRVSDAYLGTPPLTEGGEKSEPGVSTNRDTLLESGDPLLEEYGDSTGLEKVRTTFLPILRKGIHQAAHVTFNPIVNSGRTSADFQTAPRKGGVRECIVSRPWTVFNSCDWGTIELCALAQCNHWLHNGPTPMGDALRAGKDLHSMLGASILNWSYDDFRKAYKAKDPQAVDFRQLAKPINFGFPGGLGVAKLVLFARGDAYNVRFCELAGINPKGQCGKNGRVTEWRKRKCKPSCRDCLELCENFKRKWFETWPEMEYYFEVAAQEAEIDGKVQQFVSDRVRGGCDFCSGANTKFQGLAGDGAKRAAWYVAAEMYCDPESPLYGSRGWNLMHDEILSEVPYRTIEDNHVNGARASQAADRCAALMVKGMAEYMPDIPNKVEPTLSVRWFKGIDMARNAAGLLLPYVECPTCKTPQPAEWDGAIIPHRGCQGGKWIVGTCETTCEGAALST